MAIREIEFRAKSVDNKWHYGYPVIYSDKSFEFYEKEEPESEHFVDVYKEMEKETLCQFTGLCDKNGTKIFEGDCFGDSSNREIDVVVFEDGCFQLKTYYFAECSLDGNAYESRFGDWDTEPLCNFDLSNDEIIGNIFDNPELLRGEYE